MEEYLYQCPICNCTVPLGTRQPNRKMCPACTVRQAQERIIIHHQQQAQLYRQHKYDPSSDALQPPPRPMTQQQLHDALFNIKIKEQLKQCANCLFSSGKGINLFCDHIARQGHSTQKGSGPGDCRSYIRKATKHKKR